MKIYFSIILLILISQSACDHGSSVNVPKAPLTEEKFVEVLEDVRLLEGAYTVRYQRVDSTAGLMDVYYNQVFEKHQVTREEFELSYTSFSLDVPVMERIEDSVIHRLERMDDNLKTDSIESFKFKK